MNANSTTTGRSSFRGAMAALVVAFLLVATMLALASSAGGPGALPALAADQAAGPEAAGTLVMTMTVEAKSTPAEPGDVVTYTIEVEHQGGTTEVKGGISNTVPSGLQFGAARVSMEEVSAGVSPLKVRVKGTTIQWLGTLDNDAKLRITYPARVADCYATGPVTATNTVKGKTLGGGTAVESVDLPVQCFDGVYPNKSAGNHAFKGSDEELQALIPGAETYWHMELTNSDTKPMVVGIQAGFPRVNGFNIGMPPELHRLSGLGWDHGGGAASLTAGHEVQTAFFRLRLNGNTTKEFDFPLRLLQIPEPGSEYQFTLGYCITEDGRTCPGSDPGSKDPPPSFQVIEPITLTVRYRDLGDAPDSTNHAAAPMLAYPTVQAHFPTVFDPATGSPQGPAHLKPRPFHLGRKVSPEAEADFGPDLDPTNNIRPAANVANRDRHDDGLRLFSLAFQDCSTTTFPVGILIRPAAVTYLEQHGGQGYLNVWLDANRDGDWADSRQCGSTQALEHIVIDHEVDAAALGPGPHVVNVTTGLVPWPALGEKLPTWLRVTLSEKPSNKTLTTGGVAHGDGRGYAQPFVLGETEDYAYWPAKSPKGGVDLQVEARAKLRPVAGSGNGLQAGLQSGDPLAANMSLNYDRIYVTFRAENVGSQEASSFRVRVPLPWADRETIQFQSRPSEDRTVQVSLDGNTVIYEVQGVQDVEGTVSGTNWCLTCTLAQQAAALQAAVDIQVSVESDEDTNPDNDLAAVSLQTGLPAPIAFLKTDHSCDYGLCMFRDGTTDSDKQGIPSRYLPGATMHVFADGTEIATVSSQGIDTVYESEISPALGGRHIWVVAEYKGEMSPPSKVMYLNYNPDLPWDPSSLTFVDSKGRIFRPFDGAGNGASVAHNWAAHIPGGTVVAHLASSSASPADEFVLQISAELGAGLYVDKVQLLDPDGDGIYSGAFTVPTVASGAGLNAAGADQLTATLIITSDNTVSTYDGSLKVESEGIVSDATTGQALAGADVTVFEIIRAGGDTGTGANLWAAEPWDQENPQTTGADGGFAFWLPAGTYQFEVSNPGYQPYRSAPIVVTEQWLKADVQLTPVVDEEADYIIEMGRNGPTPSALWIRPGSVVQWLNLDVDGHTTTGGAQAQVQSGAAGSGWDSGVLSPGEAFTVRLDEEGTFSYSDRAQPLNSGDIVVDARAPITVKVFLPLILRE